MIIILQSTLDNLSDRSDSQGAGISVRLSEMSDLSDIQNIMQIRRATPSVS